MKAAPLMLNLFDLNLRFGRAADGPQAWPFRREVLRVLLQRETADFYCFQEANDFQTAFLSASLPHCSFIGQRAPAPDFWQNNLIFYRPPWRLCAQEHFFLSPTPGIPSRWSDSRWPRQCTLGLFARDADVRLVVATTHLDFQSAVQVRGAELIRRRIAAYGADQPAILAGDFNCLPSSACHMALATGPYGFRNALAPDYPGTYHGFAGGTGQGCIDWILYRGGLSITATKIIRSDGNGVYPSDHFPLATCFEMDLPR